jgi:NADH-quinone oxidoreductase subunit N
MIFLPVFDNFLISHFIEVSLAVYLLAYLSYAVAYNGAFEFSFPPLLKSTLSFSVFILIISFVSLVTISAVCEFDGAKNPSNSMLLIIVFRCLVLLSSIGILLITRTYADTQRIIKYEYDMLIMFSILSLLILSSSDDFLMLYLAIELQSLCFYVLATFKRNSVFSTEAGLKYFILGAFSSGLLLFGFVLSYVTFGTTSFETLAKLTIGANGYLAF